METDITGVQKTPEHPCEKVRRIARDLADALNDVEGYQLAIVYPSNATQLPISICLEPTYARQMRAFFEYRTAWNAVQAAPYRSKKRSGAQEDFREAQQALHRSFDGEDASC